MAVDCGPRGKRCSGQTSGEGKRLEHAAAVVDPAADIALGSEDLAQIDQISLPGGLISDFWQTDPGPHLYRW